MKTRLVAASIALVVLGCARQGSVAEERERLAEPASQSVSHGREAVSSALASTGADAPSLYDLPLSLTDETGTVRPLDAFRGHPVLITMFYGSCASACPLLTTDLKRLAQRIPEPARADLRILMVSFDAARDTPAVLTRLMQERGVNAPLWTFASATDDDARQLAGVLDIRYRKLDNGEFFHSSAIVLLDASGHPRARLDGLGRDAAPIVSAFSAPGT